MKQSLVPQIYRRRLGNPVTRWVVVLGSIAYLLSSIDFSPDVIPILGWVDDGVLAALLATGLTEMLLERQFDGLKDRLRKSRQAFDFQV